MYIKNQEVLSTRKINVADKDNILAKLNYKNFLQDITLNVIDVKDCVGEFSYENEWDAFIIANCEREHNVNGVESQLEIESSSRSNLLSDESSDNEEDTELALEQYKDFFNSWVEQIYDKNKLEIIMNQFALTDFEVPSWVVDRMQLSSAPIRFM